MIKFSTINAFEKGQRESFEDLICVLARRERPSRATEFQANEGSGGDGGVEAIWTLDDGSKIGYQAKFFLSLGEPQWRQLDKSVKQALKIHPELKRYIVAIPRDLTPERGTGKSERQKWEERVLKWKLLAIEQGSDVDFELWSETILREMLLREANGALMKYWFGGDHLSDGWFSDQVNLANKTLDDRFNPQDHVAVSIEDVFDTMARGPRMIRRLGRAFTTHLKVAIPNAKIENSQLEPARELLELLELLNNSWRNVASFRDSFPRDFANEWDFAPLLHFLNSLRSAAFSLENHYNQLDGKSPDKGDLDQANNIAQNLREVSSSCDSFIELLEERSVQVEASRILLISGPAGAGKSHILGQLAEQRIKANLPTVLILGQSLSKIGFWDQLGGLLGLESRTLDGVLGVLNAAGERKKERVFLLFDAINEGAGASFWQDNLTEVVTAIQSYSHIAAIFSCRDEYLPYAIPNTLSKELPKFVINGFSTPEELEQAAITYLDAKGIARPNTPWLSPEFRNPLLLKSVSEALHAKGSTEFPRGLNGISEIMALYLNALSWRIGIDGADQESIAGSIKTCVRLIAGKMAGEGRDYIVLSEATTIANESFKGRTAPEGKTWLQVLEESNLFRRDPQPFSDEIDPLNPPMDLIRFAFQRFQDHLMAVSLVISVDQHQLGSAYKVGGALNFLFIDGLPERGFRYEYAGLIGALSTLYPERLGVEFATTLPNFEHLWETEHSIQEGFGESFKLRSSNAFSEDTVKLLNSLDEQWVEPLELLLDVSMSVGHPFNALRLHSTLSRLKMPERDSSWTRWINWASRKELSQIDRIVSWALFLQDEFTDIKHLELASIVLAWSLTSSHMTLRDRATKALTKLFLKESDIFIFLYEMFHDCDDPYVIERLYAAAFGACCIDQTSQRLNMYSQKVFTKIFADKQPPVALLTRDYAMGIVELAGSRGALAKGINIGHCYPPFDSSSPSLGLAEEDVKKIAKERGGTEILDSASNEWGDFGKYSIPSRVSCFSSILLKQPRPISKKELKHLFVQEVISPHIERVEALQDFQNAKQTVDIIRGRFRSRKSQESSKEEEACETAKIEARMRLENLLKPGEQERFAQECVSGNQGGDDFHRIDVKQCRLWITKRAYELGWNAKLFPRDGAGSNYSRHENDYERIGKKYQRIALDEIQARLADNFWILQGWPAQPCVFRYSHHDFRRNLEPTILPSAGHRTVTYPHDSWIVQPKIKLPEVVEKDLKSWPFKEDPTESMVDKLSRVDEEGRRWLVLYEFNCDSKKYQEPSPGEHGMRYEEFRFFYCIFVKKGKAQELVDYLKERQSLNVNDFQPTEYIDGPYLGEAYWRETWSSEKFSESIWDGPKGCEFAVPIANYHWESHLDKTLPNGFNAYIPQKWFADELCLSIPTSGTREWMNKSGEVVLRASGPLNHQSTVVIDKDTLSTYTANFDVEPVWLMIAERNTWPKGSNNESCWRRSEGVMWLDKGAWKKVGWSNDTKR